MRQHLACTHPEGCYSTLVVTGGLLWPPDSHVSTWVVKCPHASPSSPAPTQQRTVGFFDSVRMQPASVNLPQTDPKK